MERMYKSKKKPKKESEALAYLRKKREEEYERIKTGMAAGNSRDHKATL